MATLGISYGFHDATAAVVHQGKVLAACAEERLSRQKHDANFPMLAIRSVLAEAGLTAADLDFVAYHERPSETFTRVVASTIAPFPRSRREFTVAMKAWLGKKLWVEGEIATRLGIDPAKIALHGHHESHAAQAFLGSGWTDAAILTIDAVGEWATTSLAHGRRGGDGKPVITPLVASDYPSSLGLVYSAVTAWLGFEPMDSECSTMALAAFGQPRYAREMRQVMQVDADGRVLIDASFFHFDRYFDAPWSSRFLDVFGAARPPEHALPFDSLAPARVAPQSQRWADVAASAQLVFEECLLALARRLHVLTGAENLCFAGGAALNCVANARLLDQGPFKNVYVPPDPGDGGAAVGAALLADAKVHGQSAEYRPFVGPARSFALDEAMLAHVEPKAFRRHLKLGLPVTSGERWEHTRYETDSELARAVAADLTQGAIVGWVQGRAESGPRALGARSILIRPDLPELAKRLSETVKDRARYRPYALSMTREDAARLLETRAPADLDRPLYRWMQASVSVRPEARSGVACGLHVDGTTRPQIVDPVAQPRFHALLGAFGNAVVNTSFNESGFPLVTTPFEALAVFARTAMDVLVIENTVIRKQR